jgi:hypothetical protein
MTPLSIIPGAVPGTYALGYVTSSGAYRNKVFSPVLSFFEAYWLLQNECYSGVKVIVPSGSHVAATLTLTAPYVKPTRGVANRGRSLN